MHLEVWKILKSCLLIHVRGLVPNKLTSCNVAINIHHFWFNFAMLPDIHLIVSFTTHKHRCNHNENVCSFKA